MDFTGSGFSAVFSSSCMPFLKALMPCATSPIRSEILPRPNNSRTTAITTIQCQMLSEPILQPSKHPGSPPSLIFTETRRWGCQKQGLRPPSNDVWRATVNREYCGPIGDIGAFSSEVDTGSRKENAPKPESGASVLILSESKR